MNAINPEGARLGGKTLGWSHWTTPQVVIDAVLQVGDVGLDPCSNVESLVPAFVKLMGQPGDANDGLKMAWHTLKAKGLVFVNPPYANVKAFAKKAILEATAGAEIILLVAARMDTQWTHGCLQTAQAACFWEGRIRFENPPPGSLGNAPSIPSALYYWGFNRRLFMHSFATRGFVIDLGAARERKSFPVQVRP